jgi:hypothetical protein
VVSEIYSKLCAINTGIFQRYWVFLGHGPNGVGVVNKINFSSTALAVRHTDRNVTIHMADTPVWFGEIG